MKPFVKLFSGLFLVFSSVAALAAAQLDVRITPANSELKANIEGYVGSPGERDQESLEHFSIGAQEQAQRASQALGYYQARIDSEVVKGKDGALQLVINVQAGEPIHLRNVTVRVDGPAASLKAFRIPKSAALTSGAVLNHGHYEDAKRLILNQASRYGFFSGRFTQQRLSVDPAAGVADIDLVYDSGPRYSLGKVSFSGNAPFDDDLLRRMVPFKEGTPYDSELIAELNQAMQASGYFEGVRVDAAPTAAVGQSIPVTVALDTRKPRTMGLGLGYSTDVGPRGKANWTRHWVNPQGHSYGIESELSAPRQNVGLWYDIPLDPPLTDKLRFAGGYQYEEIAGTDTLSKLLTVGPEWHSRLPSGWERVISLKWQREEYRLGDDSGLSTLLMPGISYSFLRSDNRIDPHNGYRLQFDAQVAKEGLMSDSNLLHGNVLLKGLTTLGQNHRLLGRVQFGGNATNGYKSIPPSLRFFAGGDQSVRGYD
ncbi:MAG: autotransporter assembly complex family protein, partial [Pseudomonas sp.]